METSRADAFSKELGALRTKYAENLPNRMAEIERCWEQLYYGAWPETGLKGFHRLVHSLAGSSGTYGYTAISQAARALEMFVKSLLDAGALDAEQRGQISRLLSALVNVSTEPLVSAPTERVVTAAPSIPPRATKRAIYLLVPNVETGGELGGQIGHFGFAVQTFAQIDQLKAALAAHAPAAIVLDSPNVNLLSELAAEEGPPIILITTDDNLHARLAAVRAGATGYFIKPIDVTEFAEQLDLLIERHAADPFRILIVDDSADTAEFIAVNLREAGMLTLVVNDPLQVMGPLKEFKPDVILMDLYMPGCTGLELAAVIRQQHEYLSIPIVYLSTETNLKKQLDAMRLGGDEFLTKPIEPFHLVSAVASRSQRSRVLRSLMVRDGLTGLLNHTATEERLGIEVARAYRGHSLLAYAMLDLDHFKQINDTYGHPVGDRVLKSLAHVLQQRLRKTDVIGRYGGEEFAVILPDTDGRNASRVLDEIRVNFAQIQHTSGGAGFFVTFSCGIAVYPHWHDALQLSDAADRAMYEAKHQGRNRIVLAGG
ncbi:MAG: diguanylate cyclase [Chloroflexi bacterium]|nr:diguanylate cyclase [Chloroflexota bacterium]